MIQHSEPVSFTFLAGSPVSDWHLLREKSLVQVLAPSPWTSATMGIDVSLSRPDEDPDKIVSFELVDLGGAAIAMTVAAGKAYPILSSLTLGYRWVRLRSGSVASPTNQVSATTVQAVLRFIS